MVCKSAGCVCFLFYFFLNNKTQTVKKYILKELIYMGTGKSDKGVVGKYPMASKRKGKVGEGVDFIQKNLTSVPEIDKSLQNRKEF
jgi:hypothetical protein